MYSPRKLGLLAIMALMTIGCQDSSLYSDEEKDVLLVNVYDRSLYLSDMEGMFPLGSNAADSQKIIQAFSARWIEDALILHEAEQNIPPDLNLDKLVEDYRASLLRLNFEEKLVGQKMDSTVTEQQLALFYEQNKEQYQLETPIIRCYFVKVPQPVPNPRELRRLWNSEDPDDFEALVTYCNQYAEAHTLEDSIWHKVDDIALSMPKGSLTHENVGNRRDQSLRNNDFQYYLRILEVKKRTEISPLSYIREQARRAILHKRKVEFLETEKREIFDREMGSGNIRTYY